ncbi:ABC transporter permease [Candidatus Epulonipiscium viviparus]|uniref:ABC transporter permease n=1 Tax=Candidatus Epulonipiscium viviparus TaxID=420336 RepID=UPI0027380C8C|nr:ABC transporter permease [Candidatus Epulopiscium viviparus]
MKKLIIPLISLLISLLAGVVVILIIGRNPITAYQNLLQGSGLWPKPSYAGFKSMFTDFMVFLNTLTPMIFAALAVVVAFKAGLFNIGVASQMLLAGFIATITVGYSSLNPFIAKPLVVVIGMVVGALVAGLIGYLKYKFNINEVVSSIMFNYIIQYVVSYFINTKYIDVVSRQSRNINAAASLTLKNVEAANLKMDIPLGFILAIIAVCVIEFIGNRTKIGYEVDVVGKSKEAATYAGIRVGATLIKSMLLSGALAGLAGVTYYLGLNWSIQPRVLPTVGFDAIAVALFGNLTAAGSFVASFIVTIITKGSAYMSSISKVPAEIASVITALILLCSASGAYIKFKKGGF